MQNYESEDIGQYQDIYTGRPQDMSLASDIPDWQVIEGDIDPRGWTVQSNQGDDFGKVDDLLVDNNTDEVAFLVIKHGGIMGMGGEMTLIPLDHVMFDRDNLLVIFDGTADDLKNAPKYTHDTSDYGMFYDYWSGMRGGARQYGREEEATGMKAGMMETGQQVIPEYGERLETEKHAEQVGEAVVHKEVETHPETIREQVAKTRIRAFRREVAPGEQLTEGQQTLKEGETIRVPIIEERLEVEKRPEVTGEVVIEPETVHEQAEVTEQVRKEHVTVEQHGEDEFEEEEDEEEAKQREGGWPGYK